MQKRGFLNLTRPELTDIGCQLTSENMNLFVQNSRLAKF
jgi:hypothetical protein